MASRCGCDLGAVHPELERVAERPAVSEVLRRAGQRAGGADGVAIVESVRSGRDRP